MAQSGAVTIAEGTKLCGSELIHYVVMTIPTMLQDYDCLQNADGIVKCSRSDRNLLLLSIAGTSWSCSCATTLSLVLMKATLLLVVMLMVVGLVMLRLR